MIPTIPHPAQIRGMYRYRRTLLSAWLLDLVGESNTDQSVMWLELLQCLRRIVDQGESSCLSTTELCLETENVDLVLVGLVHLGELSTELILGDVGSVWVENITVQTPQLETGSQPSICRPNISINPTDISSHLPDARELN